MITMVSISLSKDSPFSRATKLLLSFVVLACLMVTSLNSHAIDLNPFDVVAPSPNKRFFSVSLSNSELVGSYNQGIRPAQPSTLTINQLQLRAGRSYEVGGMTGLSFLQLPIGSLQPGGSASAQPIDDGLGDLTIATALWPYSNRQTGTYLALAGYLTLPTGSYSNQQLFNLGGNRVSGNIQVAYQTKLTKKLDGVIGMDVMFFGANNKFGQSNAQLTQKPLYTAQLGPIYNFNSTFALAATYLYVWGAETSISGFSNNNSLQSHRYLLSAVATTSKGRFMLQYGSHIDAQFGFSETRRLILRYAVAF